ncbi:MAG: DUF1573 domain-containing protein [Myxococcota bacterium]|nr:DUF1573 domain-containing protein [Myxococcota bacterium]
MNSSSLVLLWVSLLLLAGPSPGWGEIPPVAEDRPELPVYRGRPTPPVRSSSPIQIPHTRHVLPPALQGDRVRHDFVISNDSERPLALSEVGGCSGCVVESYTRNIPPGLEGRISVLFLTDSRGGEEIRGTLHGKTDHPEYAEFSIDYALQVREFAALDPYRIWLEGSADEAIIATSTVTPSPEYPFAITGIRARKGVWFRVEWAEIEQAGRRAYRITVTNTRKKPGSYQDVLFVQTDHPVRPELTMRIEGRIRPHAGSP